MPWKFILPAVLVVGFSGYVIYTSFESPYTPEKAVVEPEPVAVAQPETQSMPEPEIASADEEPASMEPGEASLEAESDSLLDEQMASTEPEAEAEVEQAGLEIVEPPKWLSGSDDRVRQAAADLEQSLVKWLVPDEQLRKWVLMVDQMADGQLPIKHRPVQYPLERFLVYKKGDKLYQDGGNFARWTPLVNAVTAIDTALLATYYRRWLPLMEKAYDELGKPGNFDQRVRALMDLMIYADIAPENAALVRPHIFYQYADPRLEAEAPLVKWLWRMGEANMLAVQGFLRDLKAELS